MACNFYRVFWITIVHVFPAWTVCVYMCLLCYMCFMESIRVLNVHVLHLNPFLRLLVISQQYSLNWHWKVYEYLTNGAKTHLYLCKSGGGAMYVMYIIQQRHWFLYGAEQNQLSLTSLTTTKDCLKLCNFLILKVGFLKQGCLKGGKWQVEKHVGGFFGLWATLLILEIPDKLESGFSDFSGGTSKGLSEV